jgi:hypothetical protein
MRLKYFLSQLFTCCCCSVFAQTSVYSDPNFTKPASGYGSDGTHTVAVASFSNPYFPSQDINIYYPSDVTGNVPTIFYSHAFGGSNPANVDGMLYFVAKKGYAIVFVPYQTTGVTVLNRYANLLNGFRMAARNYPAIIDTTRVGFLGWSFGGGASFANSYTCFTENNWGQNGRFVYALAQWYSYNISQTQLQSFPTDVKLLTEIFDEDVTNDHRMAMDIFNNINLPAAEKDFLLMRSDTIGSYNYVADHTVPNCTPFNALDYYGYYRLLDALCDYTFNGSTAGKNVALGHGSAVQVTMPSGLKPLQSFAAPTPVYPESKYEYPCSDSMNLRLAYCPSVTTGIEEATAEADVKMVYPNPFSTGIQILNLTGTETFVLCNALGQFVYSGNAITKQDFSGLQAGMYFLTITDKNSVRSFKLSKQ